MEHINAVNASTVPQASLQTNAYMAGGAHFEIPLV